MIDWITGLAGFGIGIAVVLLAQYELAVWRASRRPPTKQDVSDLLHALSVWADKYAAARPSGRYLKRREAELFAACTKVGLMWIRQDNRGDS